MAAGRGLMASTYTVGQSGQGADAHDTNSHLRAALLECNLGQDVGRERSRTLSGHSDRSLPSSFKAARLRKTPEFIRQVRVFDQSSPRRDDFGLPERRLSEIDPRLLDDTDTDKLIAGVARLIYRHMAESESDCSTRGGTGRGDLESCTVDSQGCSVAGGSTVNSQECESQGQLRTEDFDDIRFFRASDVRSGFCARRRAMRCCCRRFRRETEEQASAALFQLLQSLLHIGHFPRELVVLSAIYIERLLASSRVRLSSANWRPISVAALLLSSKVWEDIHPWNADFAMLLRAAGGFAPKGPLSLYSLESKFLEALDWRAAVTGEVYAAYYFALCEADGPTLPNRSRQASVRRFATVGGMYSIDEAIESTDTHQNRGGRGGIGIYCNEPLARRLEEPISMENMLWLDRTNPFVGNFGHAPRALPPSRHIHVRGQRWSLPSGGLPSAAPTTTRRSSSRRGSGYGIPEGTTYGWASERVGGVSVEGSTVESEASEASEDADGEAQGFAWDRQASF